MPKDNIMASGAVYHMLSKALQILKAMTEDYHCDDKCSKQQMSHTQWITCRTSHIESLRWQEKY